MAWQNTGSLKGPKGDQGPKGDKGEKGDPGDNIVHARESSWQTVPLESGWVNYSAPGGQYTLFGFKRMVTNSVRLKGIIKDGTTGTLFTLPAGFRPPYREMFYVGNDTATLTRIDVHPSGLVTVESTPSNKWVSLNTIDFAL